MLQEKMDELLELCYVLDEQGKLATASSQQLDREFQIHQPHLIQENGGLKAAEILAEATSHDLLYLAGERLSFTTAGRRRAEGLVRRHRLAEKLFTDVLELSYDHSESTACKIEHILSEEVTDSVCSFLGHPPMCPHGKSIPRGRCCHKFVREVAPIVTPLTELDIGADARIVFIASRHTPRLQKLSSMGLVPGHSVRLIQKRPSFVVQIGEMQIALDPEIVSEIYVRGGPAKE